MNIFSKESQTSTKIAIILAKNGADPNILNSDKWAPIHIAVKRGSIEAV